MARSNKQLKFFGKRGSGLRIGGDMASALQEWGDKIAAQAARPASRAGALVFYHEMKQKVPVGEPYDGGSSAGPGGMLYDSLYHAFSKSESYNNRQVYHIGPNKAKAPHWFLVENGHWRVNVVRYVNGRWSASKERLPSPVWVPGKPYIAPTFDGKVHAALTAMRERMREKISEISSGMKVG